MPLKIALFERLTGAPSTVETSWGVLCTLLKDVAQTSCAPCVGHGCEHKKGRAWSPTIFEGKRSQANALEVSCAVFDLDSFPKEALEPLAKRLEGLAYVLHETHAAGSYRLVLPLSAPIPAVAWRSVHEWLAENLGLDRYADRAALGDSARLYFLPSTPAGEARLCRIGEGKPVDVGAAPTTPAKPREAPATPVDLTLPQGPDDLDAARADLRGIRTDSKPLADTLLTGEALALSGNRDNEINRAMSLIARATTAPVSVDGALALVRPSIANMPVEPEGLNYWLARAKDCYTRALKRRLESDAAEARETARVIASMGGKSAPEKNLDPEKWQERLAQRSDKDGNLRLNPTPRNAYLIFKYDPAWAGLLKFDVLHKTLIVAGTPLEGVSEQAHEAAATAWLSENYGLELSYGIVSTEFMRVALETQIDPLAEYLRVLKWDGNKRLDSFLTECLGVEEDDLVQKISRRWLISCVARALRPGAKVDTVLVLVGKQGSLKSTSLGILAGEFFSDTAIDMGSKDGRSAASNHWIIELSELTSLRRADDETTKAFLSAAVDSYRPPYARVEVTRPRRCVFVGSTNNEEFLRDMTGNRRYWPVIIGTIDSEALKRDRDQLWAEAVEAFQRGERWWLDAEETALQEERTAEHMETSHWNTTIAAWIIKMPVAQRPTDVTIDQVALDCLGFTKPQLTKRLSMEIAVALKQLGFVKERSRKNGARAWRWITPKNLRPDIGIVPS